VSRPCLEYSRARHYLGLAKGAGDSLIASADRTEAGLCWMSNAGTFDSTIPSHLMLHKKYSRCLHTGISGIGVFLVDLAALTGNDHYLVAAEQAAAWLLHHNNTDNLLPGLYFGEAGTAAFLCRLAQVTANPRYFSEATAIARRLTPHLVEIPDLTHGWAGIGLLHLKLARSNKGDDHLALAREFGDALVRSAERMEHGVAWRHPSGLRRGLSGQVLTGFAHGAAGIGYFLLELSCATGDTRYEQVATDAAEWLCAISEPCLPDNLGCRWVLALGDTEQWFFWCHGVAGIGLFFLKAWMLTNRPHYRDMAIAAARTIADGGRRGGTTLCHGLAGNGDFLIEAYRVLGDARWLKAASVFSDLLELYSISVEGGIAWPGDQPGNITPDYMVGYAGVGAFMLRMAAPDHIGSPLLLPLSWPD
jgi:lantibiotic modifying enzyme